MQDAASQKTYQWNADDYARNSSAQRRWAQELIGKLSLQGNEQLLDLGCGDGKITAHLANQLKTGQVAGIDASSRMIAFAQQQFPPSQYPNLSFQPMDATALDLGQKFDVVFSNAVLHWIEDHIAVLKSVHRHLKPGGKILWQCGGKGTASELLAVIQRLLDAAEWADYFRDFVFPYSFYGIEDYQTWLPTCGFVPERLELIPKDMTHQGKEGLKGWLRTTWFPYTDCLPDGLKEPFLQAIVDAYTRQYPLDAAGLTHVKMIRLEVAACAC